MGKKGLERICLDRCLCYAQKHKTKRKGEGATRTYNICYISWSRVNPDHHPHFLPGITSDQNMLTHLSLTASSKVRDSLLILQYCVNLEFCYHSAQSSSQDSNSVDRTKTSAAERYPSRHPKVPTQSSKVCYLGLVFGFSALKKTNMMALTKQNGLFSHLRDQRFGPQQVWHPQYQGARLLLCSCSFICGPTANLWSSTALPASTITEVGVPPSWEMRMEWEEHALSLKGYLWKLPMPLLFTSYWPELGHKGGWDM